MLRATAVVAMVFAGLVYSTERAHALDKRLGLIFKTAGYGAAAGAVIGAGTVALGLGGFRNVLMGASSGMYAGILLGAYVVLTPDETGPSRGRARNPYPARRPVGPQDWEDYDEEEVREHLPPEREDQGALLRPREVVVWAPVLTVVF
jgi:hypothetical protein